MKELCTDITKALLTVKLQTKNLRAVASESIICRMNYITLLSCVKMTVYTSIYSGTPPYGHLVITATFFRPAKLHSPQTLTDVPLAVAAYTFFTSRTNKTTSYVG